MDNIEKRLFDNESKYVKDFLVYMQTIKGKSPKTVFEYGMDLRTFFRYIIKLRGLSDETDFEKIPVENVGISLIASVTLSDIYEYLLFLTRERNNGAAARSRKISSLRSFYGYMCDKMGLIKQNPTRNLETPKKKKALPKYLSLEESMDMLNCIDGNNMERDFCILTLFLNCGMRLSELVGINFSDIHLGSGQGDYLIVTGKGNKQRNIYLNKACVETIEKYLDVRPRDGVKDKDALFLSRLKGRISVKTVQWIVKKYLEKANLSGKGYSVHKLRHTAATLMYQQGGVDIRVLQKILGHENLSTTEIYTHLSNEQVRDAMQKSPLANFHLKNKTQKKDHS